MAEIDKAALEKLVRQVLLEKLRGAPAPERPECADHCGQHEHMESRIRDPVISSLNFNIYHRTDTRTSVHKLLHIISFLQKGNYMVE